MTEFEPSAPLPERPKWVDVFGSIPDHPPTDDDAAAAEVAEWKMLARFARERAEKAEELTEGLRGHLDLRDGELVSANSQRDAALAEVASLRDTLATVRAEHATTRADLAAERETRQRVEALCDELEALPYGDQMTVPWSIRRALSRDAEDSPTDSAEGCLVCGGKAVVMHDEEKHAEPERCPHVAEPGSRHEDEDCPCVETGGA